MLLRSLPSLKTAWAALVLSAAAAALPCGAAEPETKKGEATPQAAQVAPAAKPGTPPQPALPERGGKVADPFAAELVEADVSTRSVAITSSFTGTEIVVFGSVHNSRQESAEGGLYDIVIVLEGVPGPLVARKKSNVAGIWLNARSVNYENMPSYYAIASTRPLDEVASDEVLDQNAIGFQHVTMTRAKERSTNLSEAELKDFRSAVIRLKKKEGLYVQEDYGVVFIGRSLFRSSISLPANVPVGPMVATVHLFREGRKLASFTSKVDLQREGVERLLHDFAFNHPLSYGLFTVAVAVMAGLAASTIFRKGSH